MANKITKRIISEGPSKLIVQVVMEGDGEGELTNYSLLDPTSDFNPNLESYTQVSLLQVWYSGVWFDVVIGFNALNPTKSWVLARDVSNYHDFRYFGGLKDTSGVEHDGKLLLSTSGFDVPGSVGSLVIELRKNNAPNPVEYQSGNLA
jgi:hypothetical protein